MIGSLSDWIGSRSSLKTRLALLGLVCLFVPILAIIKASVPDPALPGGQLSYSAEQAYRALSEVGSDGRRWFTVFQLVDLLFIPAYTLLFATTINVTYRTLLGRASIWTGLCLVPL